MMHITRNEQSITDRDRVDTDLQWVLAESQLTDIGRLQHGFSR